MNPYERIARLNSAIHEVAILTWKDTVKSQAFDVHTELMRVRKEILETQVIGPHIYCPDCELQLLTSEDAMHGYGCCAECFS